jgi:hypothetical protein
MIRLGIVEAESTVFTEYLTRMPSISSRQFSTFAGPNSLTRGFYSTFPGQGFLRCSALYLPSSLPALLPHCDHPWQLSGSTPPTGAWLQCVLLRQLHSSQTSGIDVRDGSLHRVLRSLLCLPSLVGMATKAEGDLRCAYGHSWCGSRVCSRYDDTPVFQGGIIAAVDSRASLGSLSVRNDAKVLPSTPYTRNHGRRPRTAAFYSQAPCRSSLTHGRVACLLRILVSYQMLCTRTEG